MYASIGMQLYGNSYRVAEADVKCYARTGGVETERVSDL